MNTETKQTSNIIYQPYNYVEAQVAREKAKIEHGKEKLFNCINKNMIILNSGQQPNPLSKIIKQDGESKLITLRIGTKPLHKLVTANNHKDMVILKDLQEKVSNGFFDEMIKDFYSKPAKRKTKAQSISKDTPPEMISYSLIEETNNRTKRK